MSDQPILQGTNPFIAAHGIANARERLPNGRTFHFQTRTAVFPYYLGNNTLVIIFNKNSREKQPLIEQTAGRHPFLRLVLPD
jgi:hypothetical protein